MAAVDDAIATPATYGDEARLHAILTQLRNEDPVHWTEPEGFRPYWAITKYADVLEIEKQSDKFLNEPRSVLMDKKAEHDSLGYLIGAFLAAHSFWRPRRLLAIRWALVASCATTIAMGFGIE